MIIPLAIFYYLYLVVIGFYVIYSFFNLYHLWRFGFFSLTNILIMTIFIAVSYWLITFSFSILAQVDWQKPLFDLSNWSGLFNIAGIKTDVFNNKGL